MQWAVVLGVTVTNSHIRTATDSHVVGIYDDFMEAVDHANYVPNASVIPYSSD